jgi:lysophospholipase L1-like esterase
MLRIRTASIVLLSFVLLGSVMGNVGLIHFTRKLYAERLLAQVWPQGPPSPALSGTATPPATRTVLLLGDSRIADWKVQQIKNCSVLNFGVPGLTSAQLGLRCREWLQKSHPAIVVIQIGINDLKVLGMRPELRLAIVDTTVSNITAVAEECRRHGSRVLLTRIWPGGQASGFRRFVWSGHVNEAVAEVNRKLGNVPADADQLRVADLFGDLTKESPPEFRNKLYRDTLHLKDEAYARLTPLLQKAIEPWLSGRL